VGRSSSSSSPPGAARAQAQGPAAPAGPRWHGAASAGRAHRSSSSSRARQGLLPLCPGPSGTGRGLQPQARQLPLQPRGGRPGPRAQGLPVPRVRQVHAGREPQPHQGAQAPGPGRAQGPQGQARSCRSRSRSSSPRGGGGGDHHPAQRGRWRRPCGRGGEPFGRSLCRSSPAELPPGQPAGAQGEGQGSQAAAARGLCELLCHPCHRA